MKQDNRPLKIRDIHGMSRTLEYQSWNNMLTRCYNPKSDHYANYGSRGIRVCERWRASFRAFYEDMGPRPPGLTLERRDVHGDYGPDNCEWATTTKQSRNTTVNRYVEYDGQSLILGDWEVVTGIKRLTIFQRLYRDKWTVGQALGFEPPPPRKPRNVRLIEYQGRSLSMVEWARLYGVPRSAVATRLDVLGWGIGQAIGAEPPPPRLRNPNSKAAEKTRRYRARLAAKRNA